MLKRTGALAVAIILGALTLSGCAANPDVSSLETELQTVPGVDAARATVAHSGAPWNTDIVVLLFVEDPTVDSVADVTRASAPVFLADDATAKRGVSLFVTDADPTEYDPVTHSSTQNFQNMDSVADELGVGSGSGGLLVLSGDDLRALADAQ
ncbi:hypothetical protein [Microbacterium sp. C7(2022)]|uniref:hypothetical protein n=1 Tax=Microbacterium sp. C7(2022) TaxID=2992759 RepID=UPI00237BC3F4|nr:hypothetical protein [Microbacterium sp. C7(2022)]MDE0545140.1 hypothetical protein [Microbacterium sp. C7(2022)]